MTAVAPHPSSGLARVDRARAVLLSPFTIGILLIACLVAISWRETHDVYPGYGFLRWNLFLAVVPLVLAYVLAWVARREWAPFGAPVVALGWLLFLPNAPYLVSDLVHLKEGASRANLLTLGLVAAAGFLIGVKSMRIVQQVIEERFGVVWAWRAVRVMVILVTLGVYAGRVLRWNSWNVLTRPHALLQTVFRSPSEPRQLAFALATTIFSALLFYLTYWMVAGARNLDQGGQATDAASPNEAA